MKRLFSFILCIVLAFSFSVFDTAAIEDGSVEPLLIDLELTGADVIDSDSSRATGLITSYSLSLTHTGSTLNLRGETTAIIGVVKCGFKNLTVQRRKSSAYSWEDYYEYGDLYNNGVGAYLSTSLDVDAGYQYRLSCKHYAKKSLLVTQKISNTSNIVTVS